MRERQLLACARHADIREPTLFFDALLLDRPAVGKDPLLHSDQVDRAKLEPFRIVEGHQRHQALLAADRVLIREERDLLQEVRQRRLLRRLMVLARDADELLQVLEPP